MATADRAYLKHAMRRQGILVIESSKSAERKVGTLQVRLQRALGLSPAEARLAAALAQGTSLKAYAKATGVSEGTVRVQLKSVFARTKTHRQAELVALIWRRERA